MLNNKRGDNILSIYWFAIIILVAGGIFAMVYVFYGTPYDIREIEANVLINKVADCVSYSGKINSNLISSGQFTPKTQDDLLKECHLNFDSSEFQERQYYTEISFYKIDDMNNPASKMTAGNNKWLSNCAIQETKTEERLVQCVQKSFYSLDDKQNQYIIKILAVVSKSEKNVKL